MNQVKDKTFMFTQTLPSIRDESQRTAYIDVDDTLVIYKSSSIHPYGVIYGEPYEPNSKLIEKLKTFKGSIIIWSGGGSQYAKEVAEIVLPKNIKYSVKSKFGNFSNIRPGDIVVDDQKEYYVGMKNFGVHVFGPLEDWDIV